MTIPSLSPIPCPARPATKKDVKGNIDAIVIDRAYSLASDGQNPVDADGAVVRLDYANLLTDELRAGWKKE